MLSFGLIMSDYHRLPAPLDQQSALQQVEEVVAHTMMDPTTVLVHKAAQLQVLAQALRRAQQLVLNLEQLASVQVQLQVELQARLQEVPQDQQLADHQDHQAILTQLALPVAQIRMIQQIHQRPLLQPVAPTLASSSQLTIHLPMRMKHQTMRSRYQTMINQLKVKKTHPSLSLTQSSTLCPLHHSQLLQQQHRPCLHRRRKKTKMTTRV